MVLLENKHALARLAGRLRTTWWLLLLLIGCGYLTAQSAQDFSTDGVQLLARSNGRQVKLRWAPTNWSLWEKLRTGGVYLERQTILRDGQLLPAAERLQRIRLTDTLLRPADPGVMAIVAAKNSYAAIAGQAYYGKDFVTDERQGTATVLRQAREIEDRFSFGLFAADQSFEVALLMALGYVDNTVDDRETYVYRLRAGDPSVVLDSLRSGSVSIDAGMIEATPGVSGLEAVFGDRVATLSWPVYPASERYTSYFIERSTDGVTWERRHEAPYLPVLKNGNQERYFYPDSLVGNGSPYFYRLIGRTAFGEDGDPSDPVQGAGVPAAGTLGPYIQSVMSDGEGGLTISWKIKGDRAQVQSIDVLRAKGVRGPFVPLVEDNPSFTETYTDPSPQPTNYYKVRITDRYGRQEESFPALGMPIDSIPPAAPQNVRGVILKDGRVVLSWDANPEPDVGGYRVYLSNLPDGEYSLFSPRAEPDNYYVGQTTLNTLTDKLYAKVVAQDYHQNYSAFSRFAALERPDTIPPTAPLFTTVTADSNGVYLSWAGSQSVDMDRHELYQRRAGTEDWTLVRAFPYPQFGSQRHYLVAGLEPDAEMNFRISAVDRAGLVASSDPVTSARIGSPLRRAVAKLNATADRRAKTVNLRWNYRSDRGELDYFLVYRSPVPANGEPAARPETIGRLSASQGTAGSGKRRARTGTAYAYRDPTPTMNSAYRYYVRAVYADGAMSRLSPAAAVEY